MAQTLAAKADWDELWNRKKDQEIAIGIRSRAEDLYGQITELIDHMADSAGIDINAAIKADFVDLHGEFVSIKNSLQTWAAAHPDFMGWRPPSS